MAKNDNDRAALGVGSHDALDLNAIDGDNRNQAASTQCAIGLGRSPLGDHPPTRRCEGQVRHRYQWRLYIVLDLAQGADHPHCDVHKNVHIGAGYGWISVDVGGTSNRKYFPTFNDLQTLLDAHGIR